MSLLTKTAAALGEIRAAYDAPLLAKAFAEGEYGGRALPMQFYGDAVRWLGGESGAWAGRMRGQVWRINHFFATTASAVPFALYAPGKDGKPARVLRHAVLDLLYQPNADEGQSTFFHAVATELKATGNCFISTVRPSIGRRAGQPTELWRLPAANVEPRGGSRTTPVTEYRYTPDLTKPGQYLDLPRADVLHLKQYNPAGSKYGLGCIVAANQEITLDDASITAQVAQLQNMGPKGVLWFEPVDSRAPELGASVLPDLRSRLSRTFSGPRAAGQFPILTNKVGWTSTGVSAVDLDILNARRANFNDLCGYWLVPSILLGDKEGTTFANMGEARKMLYTQAIVPHVAYLCSELSRWLVPQFEATYWLEPDTSGVAELQEDLAAKVAWLKDAWWLTIQRRQELCGETPDPLLPRYLVPMGLVDPLAVIAAVDDDPAPAPGAALN